MNGQCHRIRTLVSKQDDRKRHYKNLYRRLLMRGYKPATILPLMQRALNRALVRTADEETTNPIFLHLRYHPDEPPSSQLQRFWKEKVISPPYGRPFPEIKNRKGDPINISKMVVAYNRPPNLGNMLSSKDLLKSGPPVSSFTTRDGRGAQ